MTTPHEHADDPAAAADSADSTAPAASTASDASTAFGAVVHHATVVETVGGTVVAGHVPATDESVGRGGPSAPFTRLVSPSAALAGRAGPDAIVIVSTAADLDRIGRWPEGADAPGLLIVGHDAGTSVTVAGSTVVAVADARLALAQLSALFVGRGRAVPGVHPAANVDTAASLANDVSVGAGTVIAAGARVGGGTVIGANCVVGAGVHIGSDSVLHANVTLYDGVKIGDRVILHAGVVLGADGFGYAASPRGAVKIHHLGGVTLGDDVEIGANTAIDRGTLDDTVVGPRTKVDNLCQIGHNVVIGSDCLIAGTAAIGGSASIGNGVIIGGNVAIADHVTIGAGARLAGRSGVTKDVPAGETWAGFPARPYRLYVRSLYLSDRLEQMWEFVKQRAQARR